MAGVFTCGTTKIPKEKALESYRTSYQLGFYILDPFIHTTLGDMADVFAIPLLREAVRDDDLVLRVARPRNWSGVSIPGVSGALTILTRDLFELFEILRPTSGFGTVIVNWRRSAAERTEIELRVADGDCDRKGCEL